MAGLGRGGVLAALLMMAAELVACGGGGGGGVVEPGDFSIAMSPAAETSGAGGCATFEATLTASGAFGGTVSLSASGLPAGATANFNPNTVTANIISPVMSVVTISTAGSTPVSSPTVTITGTSGPLTHSATVTLNVTNNPNSAQASQVVCQMSLAQDITELHGIVDANDDRVVPGITNPTVPLLNITNGPAGAANGGPGHQGNATALPAPIALAATWDTTLANQYGVVIGSEAKALANGFLEGPDINIARTLQNGRTFEAFGEDPFLVGQIATAEIEGMQSQGIIAESKHFAANNQETNRMTINEIIDERTLREIYLPAFETTVKQGNVGAVMCAYNMVNGTFMCENSTLLSQILKGEWGFSGVVTSDFGATHSTVASANAGLDLEMPSGIFYVPSAIDSAVQAGQILQPTINDKLVRRFTAMFNAGVFQNPPTNTGISATMQTNDGVTARQIAETGMVLLQNNGISGGAPLLPLNASSLHTIAVIGPFAGAAKTGGGGSSQVTPLYTVTPLAGIQNRVGAGVTVTFADGTNLTTAENKAQAADVAIVMVGDNETEGTDDSISLVPVTVNGTSVDQNMLITSVVAAQPKTIVVMKSGTGILMPWASSVPAILQAWYPGEEDGNAVAAVLFGDVNPSGKLPLTIPVSPSDPDPPADDSAPAQYPGVMVNGVPTATYSEGVFVGYRHYDAVPITPLFPFGFGLSYTTFAFSNLSVTPNPATFTGNPNQTVTVSFNVANTGTVAGADVAQVYVGIPSPSVQVQEPPKQLKGFQKISLAAGQMSPTIQITLNMRSFAYWDVTSESWIVAPGTYQIYVGDSSRSLPLQTTLTID